MGRLEEKLSCVCALLKMVLYGVCFGGMLVLELEMCMLISKELNMFVDMLCI